MGRPDVIHTNAKILDVTCGSRTIWFDKHHPDAIYCDRRRALTSILPWVHFRYKKSFFMIF